MTREQIFRGIQTEVMRQKAKWGTPDHHPVTWAVIIAEETGEVARAALEKDLVQMRTELIQIAAVCVSALEAMEETDS